MIRPNRRRRFRSEPSETPYRKPVGLARSGFTLIEVIASVALLLILAVSTAGILSAITDIGKQNGRSHLARTSIDRLSQLFREDVRGANDLVIPESRWPIELRSTTSIVQYDWDSKKKTFRRSRRRVESDDANATQVDRFLLPEDCQPRVMNEGRRVTLELQSPQLQSPWAIEAHLNNREDDS